MFRTRLELDRFPAVRAALPGILGDVARALTEDAVFFAKAEAPVDEGDLRASGHVEPMGSDWAGVFDALHALPVHDGTSTHAANPFLLRGWRAAITQLPAHLRTAAERIEAI